MGPLRALVNCAGIGWATRTVGRDGQYESAHDLEVFRKVIDAFQDYARGKPGQNELKDISSPNLQKRALANASTFVAELGLDPKCIVFTHVPNDRFDGSSLARYLAQSLGGQAVLPKVPNLETYDALHLRQESAERWSAAFLVDFEPILARCVGASIAAKPGT
jgi:hypothetical protein